ncbi:MAG: Phosphatidylinositol alpha-mannosyltransferase, partial [Frankiales bacterium]|nr:Phosphatidylinositol alpha-mannosyltransferase [Frankiales bacterium]
LAVLLDALPALHARVPDVRVLVAGPGEAPPGLPTCVELLGRVSEDDKPRLYATGDVYCAPNTFGESFGIVLAEAMATGTAVVASDLEAFRAVLDDGAAGALFPVGDAAALADLLAGLLADPVRRQQLVDAGTRTVQAYDWGVVARSVVEVYETVVAATPVPVQAPPPALETDADPVLEPGLGDDPGRLAATVRRWLAG